MSGRISARLSGLALGAVLLALPGAALAQQDEHHGDRNGNGAPHEQQAARPAPAAAAPRAAPAPAQGGGNLRGMERWNAQAHQAPVNPAGNSRQERQGQQNVMPGQGRPAYQGQPAYRGQPAYQGQRSYQDQPRGDGAGRNNGGQWRNDGNAGRNDGGQWRNNGRAERNDAGQWNHGWRQDNRYDWRGWREENRDTFHVGRYYPPYRDYSYSRLGVGFYLQQMFFGSDYWIADPWDYRLPPAYGPYHWVRYYNDVILVNTYTGQVADVIYDFFW